MFGIGPQELIIIALLLLVVFGPQKASSMARDLGRFVNEARRPVEELKSELAAAGEHWDEPTESASGLHSGDGEDAARDWATKSAGYVGKGEPLLKTSVFHNRATEAEANPAGASLASVPLPP